MRIITPAEVAGQTQNKYLGVLVAAKFARFVNDFPRDRSVDDSPPPAAGELIALQRTGDPVGKVDLLLLGDGYSARERGKFEKDARRLMEVLFSTSPFKERREDFNV